jgi:hypothetical protein
MAVCWMVEPFPSSVTSNFSQARPGIFILEGTGAGLPISLTIGRLPGNADILIMAERLADHEETTSISDSRCRDVHPHCPLASENR